MVPDEPDDEPYRKAMEKAGRLLARRPHARREIEQKLATAGFDREVVGQVIARLERLRLLDDGAFADQWVEDRGRKRGSRALAAELAAKGVPREVSEQAIAAAERDEAEVALDLASRWVRRVAGRPLREQAGRIVKMLMGRGFSYEVAEGAAKAVLPPEGWD
ncbi:MAG: regulatory protein [Actinomycetota bacterium]|nr:regulatory protein [Actinomycetota bacterium]